MPYLLASMAGILLPAALAGPADPPAQAPAALPGDVALGLIAYNKFPEFNKGPRQAKQLEQALRWYAPALAIVPQDADIFLPENSALIKKYRRLWIPRQAVVFSAKMRLGMEKYMEDGGLLITESAFHLVDVNGDYRYDREDEAQKRKFPPAPTGLSGWGSFKLDRIKVVLACPLTAGLPPDEWLPLAPVPADLRMNISGKTVLVGTGRNKDLEVNPAPVLNYKIVGRGACVFFAAGISQEEPIRKILGNLLSEEVRQWLTQN
jgi:hypothetical protein